MSNGYGAESQGVEFRVVIRGLKLDATTRVLIDAAIRSAVLREIAVLDNTNTGRIASPSDDPNTRSLINLPGRVLGLILQRDSQV